MSDMPSLLYHYHCRVTRIVDGDTLDLYIDLGFRLYRQERIRLLGLDCPELNTPEGQAAAQASREWISNAEGLHERVSPKDPWPFVLHTSKSDSFGRWLGVLETHQGVTLNDWLLDSNHAIPREK